MAYTEKYYAEFKEQPNQGLGLFAWLFRVSFRFPNFSGEASELKLYSPTPAKISKTSNETSRFAFWHPQRLDLKIRAEEGLVIDDFYVRTDRDVQIVVQYDTTGSGFNYSNVAFSGWLMPADLSEKYGKRPYLLDLSAVCGLATLKDRPITDKDGKRLQGYVSLSTVIRTALYNTGLDLPLITCSNLYEIYDLQTLSLIDGKIDPNHDPLYRTQILAESLITDTGDTMSCYEALRKVNESRRLRLGQTNGTWMAICADEAAGGFDYWNEENRLRIRTRTYSSADLSAGPDTNSSQSRDVFVDIYRNQTIRVKNDSPIIRLLGVQSGVKAVQEFGRYLNNAPNGDWGQVDNTGCPLNWTRQNLSQDDAFRTGTGTEDDPYGVVIYGAGDQYALPGTPRIQQYSAFAEGSLEATQPYKRTLKCKFRTNLIRKAKIVVLAYCDNKGPNGKGEYILAEGGTWTHNPSTKERVGILINHANDAGTTSFPGLADITISMNAISGVRELYVWLCQGEALDLPGGGPNLGTPDNRPYIIYYQVSIELERNGVDLNAIQAVITNSKRKLDPVATFTIGDSPSPFPSNRIGTTYVIGTHAPTVDWNRPEAIGDTSGSKWNLYWAAEAFARQNMQPAEVVEAKLMGRLPYGIHSSLRFLDIGRIGSVQAGTQASGLTVTIEKAGFNFIMPGVYLPWVKPGMQVTISSGGTSTTYTVTSISGLIRDPWFFTVQETVTNTILTNATISDASTVGDTTFTPYVFQITSRYEWDLQSCEVDVACTRIMDIDQSSLPAAKGYLVDPNGNLLPLSIDDSNQPVNTALQVTPTASDTFRRQLISNGILSKLGASSNISGYIPIQSGKSKLGADILFNGIKIGSVLSSLRKYQSLIPQ